MAQTVVRLEVLIASPSDVAADRQMALAAVREVNQSLKLDRNVELVARTWEADAVPELGAPAQEVINTQFADDCDILIGIFWTRIGTKTQHAESGTAEEVRRAIGYVGGVEATKRVSLFFSDVPVSLSQVDLEQYAELEAFRHEMENEGLIDRFAEREAFQIAVRFALHKHAREWGSKWGGDLQADKPSQTGNELAGGDAPANASAAVEEVGLLDAVEDATRHLERSGDAVGNFVTLLSRLTSATAEAVERLGAVNPLSDTAAADAKRIANNLADEINAFSGRADAEIQALKIDFGASLDSYENALAVAADFDVVDNDESLAGTLHVLNDLQASMDEASQGVKEMIDAMICVPRLTTRLNKARRRAASVLGEFRSTVDEQVAQVEVITREMTKLIA